MYRNILIPVDLAEPSSWEKALPVARALCTAFGARLALATVIPDIRLMVEVQWSPIGFDEMVDTARSGLDALADTIEGLGDVARYVETGGVYAGILGVGERIGADLIVLASHRPAMKDYLLGTNAARVVRHARCSVLVVRDGD